MIFRLEEICTMCDSPINKYEESNGTTCKKCGTRFELNNNEVEMCDPVFTEGLFDSPLMLSSGKRQKTEVPESCYDEFVALDKEKKDEQINTLAHEILEKYPNDSGAHFLSAVVLSNVLIRKLAATDIDKIVLSSDKQYEEPNHSYEEIVNLFKKAYEFEQEETFKDQIDFTLQEFRYMYEFVFFDNAIDKMSDFVKSKGRENLLYGIDEVFYTEEELKLKHEIKNNKDIIENIPKQTSKQKIKKKHFFPRNIFGCLGLIVCFLIIVCAIIYPFVPVARYIISGEFYDWVGVAIAVFVIIARIVHVVKENRYAGLEIEIDGLKELESLESKMAKEEALKAEKPDRIKKLMETVDNIRKEGGDSYWGANLIDLMKKYIDLPKEGFLCKCFAEEVIIMRMIETDLKNGRFTADDICSYGIVFWEEYCLIKEVGENMDCYREKIKSGNYN